MPTNMVLCVKNAIDDAVLSTSPAFLSSYPVSHLQLPARGRVARSTSAAVQEIYFTWYGAGYYLNFIKLARINMLPGSTWAIVLYGASDWTNQIYSSGALTTIDSPTLSALDWGIAPLGVANENPLHLDKGHRFACHFFDRRRVLSGKITLTDTGNPYGYLEASRLYAGDYTELTYNPDSLEFGWDEDTEQSRSAGGSLRSDGSANFRVLDVSLGFVNAAQRDGVSDLLRYAGRRKDVFLSVFPSATGKKFRDYTGLFKYIGSMPRLREFGGREELATRFSFGEL